MLLFSFSLPMTNLGERRIQERVHPTETLNMTWIGAKINIDVLTPDTMGLFQDAQDLVMVDRISALPNDLLVTILSLMPLKEAATTSVLSTRWRQIWTFVTTLDFQHDIHFQLRSYKRVRIESEIDRYLNWVNSVMKQHRGSTVKLLRVYASIKDPKYESSIHAWGRFALEKRVQNFDLVLSRNRGFPKRGGNEIKAVFRAIPSSHQLLTVDTGSALNHLCSKPDILPCVYVGCFSALSCLKYLRSLDFRSVKGITGQVLECFLCHCPALERLTVVHALRLGSFKIIGRSIALKYLHIQKHTGLMSIEISDANLVSFCYGGDEINLLLRNVPQLIEVSISSRRLSFGDCVSQLQVLRLRGFVLNNEKHVFPTYVNLKHLELVLKERDSLCVLQLASFMRASPYLHKLVLKLARTISRYYEIEMEPRYHERLVEIKQAPKFSHQFLRVVEVAEYHGRISDLEIVRYLIENAVELKELVIHPVREWYSREHIRFNMGNRDGVKRAEKWKRKQAIQQLKELVAASHVAQPEENFSPENVDWCKDRYRCPDSRSNTMDLFPDAQDLVVVDRISALPNDLLVTILSLMPLKEAATTSVLSTRWRQIWTFVTTLDFQHDILFQLRSYKRERIESELDRYLNWVNSVMKQHRGPTVKLLRVYADINDPKYESSIHTWGQFALEKRVQNFNLVLSKNRVFPKRGGNEIKAVFRAIPSSHQLLTMDTGSALNHLCSKPDILPCLYVGCFSALSCLKYLRALDFKSVEGITGQVLECFLCHCPALERLTVVRALRLGSFKIIGRSIALKYLHIQKHTGLLSIEISDANLVSFFYGGEEINLLLRNVPQLIEVSISSRRLSFGDCVSQLQVLRLRGFVLNNEKHVCPTYVNLKHLELVLKERDSLCVLQLASFMRASPYLHKLVLKLARTISRYYEIDMEPRYHERLVEIKQAPKCSHRFLRVVEVAEYHGRISDFELVRYLIENAVELKELVIRPVREWYSREHIRFNMGNRDGVKRAEKWKRKQAIQQLKELVPSTAEFICRLEQPLSTSVTAPTSTLALWPMGLLLSRNLSSRIWNSQEHY